MQLRSGELAAPAARCLPLLPSGPGGVHRATMRETRSSTPHEPSGARVIGGLSQPKPSPFSGVAPQAAFRRRARHSLVRAKRCASPCLLIVRPSRKPTGWRRGRDSNPGWSFPHTRSPGVLLQPLGHLSACQQEIRHGRYHALDRRWRPSWAPTCGGEGGIRTHVGVAPQPAFEAGPLRPLRYLSKCIGAAPPNSLAPLRAA
jgi:hypothetical protein